jgi:polyketide biosynthesis acyl carrier protein
MDTEEIFQIIIRHTCEVLPELKDHHFQSGDSLKNLGADSINRAEIVIMTLESLSLQIPVHSIHPQNIGELASMLHEKLQSR